MRVFSIALLTASTLCMSWSVNALDLPTFGGGSSGAPSILSDAIDNRDRLLGNVTEEEEAEMGAAAASVLLGAAPLVKDLTLQRYVNTVGRWIAQQSERPDLIWRFGVLDDNTANAFAAPAGYVFITKGLFQILRNETELAGVLAHEIAHVIARHHVEAMTKQERFRFVADSAQEASGRKGMIAEAALAASKELYAKGLDKEDEFEADRMGAVLAARAGYDAFGLAHVLLTLDAASVDGEFLGYMLSTHPPTSERLATLTAILDPVFTGAPEPVAAAQFVNMQKRFRPPAN